MPIPNRRDFLKVTSRAPGAIALSGIAPMLRAPAPSALGTLPNIIILVLDAMSASNLSLYGYRRRTTPNLERFAERASVFRAHYSSASFTTPGTASLLTGLYPWTHRALNESGLIARDLTAHNLFHTLGNAHHRLAFSQNVWCYYLFGQFRADIDTVLPAASFSLVDQIIGDMTSRDLAASHRAFDEFLFQDGTPPASLVYGLTTRILLRRAVARAPAEDYPRGLPRTGNYAIFFKTRDVFSGLLETVEQLQTPFAAYFHLWPPHAPYRPSGDFDRAFIDGWRPKPKPDHELGDHSLPRHMNDRRQNYDEYIADVDAQFGRWIDALEARGVLENTYIVVTSDHGEMFERGVEGHITPLLYDPVVRVPLLISAPGQSRRQDIHAPTSAVDLLPTLAYLSGRENPEWCEGRLLPTLGGTEDPDRRIFFMDAKENPSLAPIDHGSFALRTPQHKLVYYRGYGNYGGEDHFELYDMLSDPEELNNLYAQDPSVGSRLRDELLASIADADLKRGS